MATAPLTAAGAPATLQEKSEAMVMTEAWEGLKNDRKAVEAVVAALAAIHAKEMLG